MPETTTTDFDPTTTSAAYDLQYDSWALNRDFGEMHLSVLRDGDHLDMFGGKGIEAEAQYTWRLNASFAMDHCEDLINLRVDNIFRTPPKRVYDGSSHQEFIERFLADVDGGGMTMDAFIRRALRLYYINGVDIVIDKDRADVAPDNQAQESQLGLVPYLHAFGPMERLDWAVDHSGRYLWVRYKLGKRPAPDEGQEEGSTEYLTVTPTEWRLYEVFEDASQKTRVTIGPHAAGICPVVPFYFKESIRPDLPKVPLSLLTRIAPIARYLLNLISQIQIDIYRNIAFLVATGVKADEIPTEITPMGCWALPEGATLTDIAGSEKHIIEKRAFAVMLIETILRIGKLAGHSGELKSRASSGVQVAVERTDLDNEMRMTAAQAEAVEREVLRIAVSRSIGREIDVDELGYAVEYNTQYVLTGTAELIEHITRLIETDTHVAVPEPLKIMLRQLVGILANEDDAAYGVAMQQIDEMVSEDIVSSKVKGDMGADLGGGDADELKL